jgi:hypothetical protein
MRKLISCIAVAPLALIGACGGRKSPDLQPTAPQPEPMAPGDPDPFPAVDPTGTGVLPGPTRDAGLPPEPVAPGSPLIPGSGEDKPAPPNPIP